MFHFELGISALKTIIGRAGLFGGACIVYMVIFLIAYPYTGSMISGLALIPLAAAGWLWGISGGVLAGVTTGGLTVVMLMNIAQPGYVSLWRAGWIFAFNILFGMFAGHYMTLFRRLHERAAALSQAEAGLHAARVELEGRVEERTAELRAANESLRQSEEHLTLALDAVRMVTWEWDYLSGRLSWSKGGSHVFGLAVEELPSDALQGREMVHPDDMNGLWKVVQDAMQGPSDVFEFSFRARHSGLRCSWW